MIQPKSPAVLYINKLSILLVSLMLLLLWVNLELTKPIQQPATNHNNIDTNDNQSNDSQYVKTLSVNPFLRTHDEVVSNDVLPTVTTLQSTVPPFSSLKLKLHGIVYQSNRSSYVMISVQGAIQEIYSVNDKISEGLYLTGITKNQVEVDYFDERHLLNIENTRRNEEFIHKSLVDGSEHKTDLNFKQQIEYLEVDKQRNPIRLFMIRRPYAVYSNGEFQGYKIMPGSNADQFKRLGFQSGDIITYLNGNEFTGPGMKGFVIQQLTHAMHIDLTVMRGNQELNINYGF